MPDSFSSPACSLAELSETEHRVGVQPQEVQAWRKVQRERLIGDRLSLDLALRDLYARQIAEKLNYILPKLSGLVVSGYWPCKGEPDLRSWLAALPLRGARASLPEIVAKGEALRFRAWKAGDLLKRGVWGIPFPSEAPDVIPDIVVVPLVGFDHAGFRLGYGGGYFDRTLSAASKRPRVIGVGYGQSKLKTIHPLPHDVPMDVIITENEILEFRA